MEKLHIRRIKQMKNIIENIKNKKSIHYFIIFILGLLVAIPYFWLQIYETDDGYVHILRVLSAEYSTGYQRYYIWCFHTD